MHRIRLFLKSRQSPVNGPCPALSHLPIATPQVCGARRAPHFAPAFWDWNRSAVRHWPRLSKRTKKIAWPLSICLRTNWSRNSVLPILPPPAWPQRRRPVLRRPCATTRWACSSPLPEATRAAESARFSARCVHVTGPGTPALSNFWKWLATMMCPSSTSISQGWRKERAVECIARLLAFLRSSFARSRPHWQVAGYRRIPESLSGAPGAGAAAGGVRSGAKIAQCVVERSTAIRCGLAGRRDRGRGRTRELGDDDCLARPSGEAPHPGSRLSRNHQEQYQISSRPDWSAGPGHSAKHIGRMRRRFHVARRRDVFPFAEAGGAGNCDGRC